MKKLKIGDTLYRWNMFGFRVGLEEFSVVGVREYEKDVQYELECNSCNHGWNCQVLVAEDDDGKLSYIRMLNDQEDDSHVWQHKAHSAKFWANKLEAELEYCQYSLNNLEKEERERKEALKRTQAALEERKSVIELLRKDIYEKIEKAE